MTHQAVIRILQGGDICIVAHERAGVFEDEGHVSAVERARSALGLEASELARDGDTSSSITLCLVSNAKRSQEWWLRVITHISRQLNMSVRMADNETDFILHLCNLAP